MANVQQQLGVAAKTFTAWYDGVAGAISIGDALCFRPDAADGTVWDDQKLWTTVEQCDAANQHLLAGIVVAVLQGGRGSSNEAYVTLALPVRGSVVEALVDANATVGVTILRPKAGAFSLEEDTTVGTLTGGGGQAYSEDSVARAGVTANTAGSAAIERIFGIL